MRKHWVALLSMLGLAGSSMRVESQVVKGSTPDNTAQSKAKSGNPSGQASSATTANSGKLQVKQQTVRQQNQKSTSGGKQADTMTPSAYCKGANGGKANNQQVTKGSNQQVTKGNQQVTKGNNTQVTKGGSNQQVTKGSPNNQVTKGNNTQVTKGGSNQQVTKGNNQQVTKGANNQQVTKSNNQQVTKAVAK